MPRIEHGFEIISKEIRRSSKEGKAHANEVIRDGGKKWNPRDVNIQEARVEEEMEKAIQGATRKTWEGFNRRQRKPNFHEGSSQVSHKMTGRGR